MGRPPLGLIPEQIHKEQRVDDIKNAVCRYFNENLLIDPGWIKEYNELIEDLG